MSIVIPEALAASCEGRAERVAWLEALPAAVERCAREWGLTLDPPFVAEVSAAWVAPATRIDGTRAVLKLAMPHMEGRGEIAGLRFWNGDATVRLLEADEPAGAMLLERCDPGHTLRGLPERSQDEVIAGLLRRIWRAPPAGVFRPLSEMVRLWTGETRSRPPQGADPGLVREGIALFEALATEPVEAVLLATDLHAGNVLAAAREPWLVIDPKPFVGDPAYDATQHLLNCRGRLAADPVGTVGRFADLLGVDGARVRRWLFARLVAEPIEAWPATRLTLARSLEP